MSSVSGVPRPAGPNQSAQVSTQTLLNALHTSYLQSQPHSLESSTSVTVNTWLTAYGGADGRTGATVDVELAARVWEHARRRAEDGSVVLG
jgi:chitin synthase